MSPSGNPKVIPHSRIQSTRMQRHAIIKKTKRGVDTVSLTQMLCLLRDIAGESVARKSSSIKFK
jgi:hypothetical protein